MRLKPEAMIESFPSAKADGNAAKADGNAAKADGNVIYAI